MIRREGIKNWVHGSRLMAQGWDRRWGKDRSWEVEKLGKKEDEKVGKNSGALRLRSTSFEERPGGLEVKKERYKGRQGHFDFGLRPLRAVGLLYEPEADPEGFWISDFGLKGILRFWGLD